MLDAILLKQMTHILFNYWSYSLKFYSTFLLTLILYFVNLKRRDVVKQNTDLSSSNFTLVEKSVFTPFTPAKNMARVSHILAPCLQSFGTVRAITHV